MKHVFCLAVFVIFIIKTAHTQTNITNDYIITSTAGLTETTAYTNALDFANWEPYRLLNQRVQYSFDNGFTIELKSAIELVNLGYSLNLANYREQNDPGYVYPILKLLADNYIGMEAVVNQASNKHH